jgi:hypothetical protein
VVYVHKVGARDDKTVKKCAQSMVASTRSLPQRYKGEQYENIYCWNSSGEKPRKRSKIVVPKSEITKPRLNRVESRDEGLIQSMTIAEPLKITWQSIGKRILMVLLYKVIQLLYRNHLRNHKAIFTKMMGA